MNAKKWNIMVLSSTLVILALVAAVTIIIDPFLHYHKPLPGLEYPLKEERYQNDGIARHYEYEAIITGTSMTQNFKTSQFQQLWGAEAIKIAFSGASYKEVNENIKRAVGYNDEIKYVIRSLDGNLLIYPADHYEYTGYPDYLYDRNPFNDVKYLFNKEVVPKTIAVLNYTRAGNLTPSFDEYGSWSRYKTFGREEVFKTRSKMPAAQEEHLLSEEDYTNIKENVEKNILETARENPQITFYLFFPPYSICYWDALVQTKQLNAQLEAEKLAVEMMLAEENIQVFAFADQIEMIENLDNYTDSLHYGEWINEDILTWMHEGKYRLTSDNYEDYYDHVRTLYLEYDYSGLW